MVQNLPHARSLKAQAEDPEKVPGPGLLRGAEWLRALAREPGGDLTHAGFERTVRDLATAAELAARGGAHLAPEVCDRRLAGPSPRPFADRAAIARTVRESRGLTAIAHEAILEHGLPAPVGHREAVRCEDAITLSAAVGRARRARDEERGARPEGTLRERAQYLRAWREGQPLGPRLRDLHLARLDSPRTPPALLLTGLGLRETVAVLARSSPGPTLVLASPTNHEVLSDLERNFQPGPLRAFPVRAPSRRAMEGLLSEAERFGARTVIGVGGGAAQDVAKLVGLGRELYIVPTVISSDCSSNGRSVVGLARGFSCETTTPIAVVASRPALLDGDPSALAFWTQSGFADLLSELSAGLDRTTSEAGGRSTAQRALDWVLSTFSGYTPNTLETLLLYIHEVGCEDIERGTNGDRVGGEHVLYKTLLEVNPALRERGSRTDARQVASHGQICALGTLITSHLAALESGDTTLYRRLREAFQKLGVPLSWPELEALGIRREDLLRAVERARSPVWPASRLGRDPALVVNAGALLDTLFGGIATPRPE